jgi:hypothetical protein
MEDDNEKIRLVIDETNTGVYEGTDINRAIAETAGQIVADSQQPIFLKLFSHLTNFIHNLLFLNFSGINDSKIYNVFLFFLWAGIAALVWLISIGIEKPQIVFTLYCCSAWLIGLAVIFLFNV